MWLGFLYVGTLEHETLGQVHTLRKGLLAVHLWTYVKHDANVSMVCLLNHHDICFTSVTLHKAHRQVVCLRTRSGEETDGERFRKRSHQALERQGLNHQIFSHSLTFTYFLRFSETNPWAVTSLPICC